VLISPLNPYELPPALPLHTPSPAKNSGYILDLASKLNVVHTPCGEFVLMK